ncbi:MAG: ribonuclease H-like domain-containing protein [candidate division WOR-3 bacterium]|nr:ribonuclease H-like domain-containing protein [candidate division WOR-3 bacterium]
MEYLVVDIETVPIKFEEQKIIKFQIDNKRVSWGLHPAFAKIIVIGSKSGPPEDKEEIFYGEEEGKILKDFWNYLKEKKPKQIVTFNGYKFDIPFIEARSYFNNIAIPFEINKNKWQMMGSNHFDCLWALLGMNEDFDLIPLVIVSYLFGIPVPEDYYLITGKDIEKEYLKGNWQGIINHCREDVYLTEQLYLKIYPLIYKEKATERQKDCILKIAKEKGISLNEEEVENWSKKEASDWIDKYKK